MKEQSPKSNASGKYISKKATKLSLPDKKKHLKALKQSF